MYVQQQYVSGEEASARKGEEHAVGLDERAHSCCLLHLLQHFLEGTRRREGEVERGRFHSTHHKHTTSTVLVASCNGCSRTEKDKHSSDMAVGRRNVQRLLPGRVLQINRCTVPKQQGDKVGVASPGSIMEASPST
jgi:hypothetical protein